MTDEKSDSPDAVLPSRGRRPAPTIDLKATEIASDPVKPSEPIDQPSESARPETRDAAPPASERSAAAGPSASAPEQDERSKGRPSDRPDPAAERRFAGMSPSPPRASFAVFGAGLAGAGLVLVLLLALWGFGVFGARDDLAVTLAARLAALEQQVRDLTSRPQPVGLDQRVFADLAVRVGAAEQAVGRIAALEAGLAKLEATATAPRPAATDPALANRIAALETAIRSLGDLGQRADAALAAAQKNAAQPAAPTTDPAEVKDLATRVAALEQGVKVLEQRALAAVAKPGGDRAGRLAFVAIALRTAAERGDPFAQEFAAAKMLVPDPALLAPLEPYAATGVPRPVVLARELSQLANPILAAAGSNTARDSGILDRLQQNAERLVRIRPIGEGPGDDPTTIVARAEVKATHGDIAGALAEIAHLPEAARAPAQDWIRKAEMQMAAVVAARRLAEIAINALPRAEP